MWKLSIFMCLMLVISVIPKFVTEPCFSSWYYYYLYDGETPYGCIEFKSYLMFNKTDDVYLTIEVSPYGTLTIYSFTIEIGDYKVTLLKDTIMEADYAKTIRIPKDLLGSYNDLNFEIYWKHKWSATVQVDSAWIYPSIIIRKHTYYDLRNEYYDLMWNYSDLWKNYSDLKWNYTLLNSSYISLNESYYNLLDMYNDLKGNYSALKWNYTVLNQEYRILKENYDSLTKNYESVLSTGAIATSLDIIFLIIIIALVWERGKLKKKLQS
ncbi:MAG TPA: hypothetical protein ENG40_03165 [Thermoprotei archaeon]|nr:hypothetical protein [Thermoprotei archaeon]